MFTHYLKIAWRNILKDRLYSAINIAGLSVAVASCLLLIFWIRFELSYETGYPASKQIYKLLEEETRTEGITYRPYIRPGIADNLKETFPQIRYSVFTRSETLPFRILGKEGDGIMCTLVSANEDFLRMFAYEYVEGSPESVIKNRGAIMSEETARKFFGRKSAIGETVNFSNLGMDTYTIHAVVKMPKNTHIRFDILDPLSRDGGYGGVHYIQLADGYAVTPEFGQQMAKFLSATRDTENRITLQPIRRIHLHSPKEVTDRTFGSLAQIYLFSGAALLILLIAVINYVNTSVARAMSRMREVGVRKVFGANRRRMAERFLFESFILSLIAVFISLVLVELLFPAFSQMMGNRVPLVFDGATLFIALLTAVTVAVLSGGYAAFYLSSFNPVLILKGGAKTGSKERLRETLIGVQFFLSISVLICTVFIYKQVNAIFNAETGVDRKNILILNTSLWYQAEDFIQTIKKGNPNVLDASIALSAPYNSSYNYSGVSWTGSDEGVRHMEFTQIFCDHNYAGTFGLEVIQGEFIPPGLSWWQDSNEKSYHIVINEAFKKLIGEENPLGITVTYGWGMQGKIIGVLKDFNFKPLKEPVSPLIISYNPEACFNVYIKTTGRDKRATREYILAKYEEMKRDDIGRPAMLRSVDDEYGEMYENELRTAGMLSVFSVVSLLLALMGIVSMISFMIEKRSKEVAIRRINGAKIRHIVGLFSQNILKVAFAASVVSVPFCYLLMNRWLQTYIYRTTLSWWIFLVIPLLIMAVTLGVIALQLSLTARKNLIESLKNE